MTNPSHRVVGIAGASVIAGIAFIAGRATAPRSPVQSAPEVRRVLYYQDPMHPSYRSDKPGVAPDCGMALKPVYAGENILASNSNAVTLTPNQEQNIALESESVRQGAVVHRLRVLGRVVPDETRTFRVSAGADGWIKEIFAGTSGSLVKKGDSLAAIYGRDILSLQQAYLYNLDAFTNVQKSPGRTEQMVSLAASQLAQARDKLAFLGMSEAQIEEIGRTRRESSEIVLKAPVTGFVIARNAAAGQRFDKGAALYEIADLSQVWILADAYNQDSAILAFARSATISATDGSLKRKAAVSAIPLQFNPTDRIGKLRLEAANADYRLRPNMAVDVDLEFNEPSALTVSTEAVLDSGLGKHVYVKLGSGRYERREVQTGWEDGDRVQILAGLRPGESVVTAGAFLVDSESRMRMPRQN